VLLFGACASGRAPAPDLAPEPPAVRTVWDGVYTAAQAERSATRYSEDCSTCHAANMRGGPGGPNLTGVEFLFTWNGRTANELVEFVRTSMPPGAGGSLTDANAVDLVAAIFRSNGFPPSPDRELPPDTAALAGIRITRESPNEE
jgi:cytochrome c